MLVLSAVAAGERNAERDRQIIIGRKCGILSLFARGDAMRFGHERSGEKFRYTSQDEITIAARSCRNLLLTRGAGRVFGYSTGGGRAK